MPICPKHFLLRLDGDRTLQHLMEQRARGHSAPENVSVAVSRGADHPLRSAALGVRLGGMAELPELRTDRMPVRPPPPRQLFDRDHTFGVSHDLERMRQGVGPAPRAPRIPVRSRRSRRGLVRRWMAAGDRRPVDLWRKVRCRTGHHDFRGGEQMQLGSRFVHVERRCIWCDAAPPL